MVKDKKLKIIYCLSSYYFSLKTLQYQIHQLIRIIKMNTYIGKSILYSIPYEYAHVGTYNNIIQFSVC